ncbi:hypothetical protein WS68_23885 [Burkholderia sp. TSV86]|nr:hypothetical protein WS68_23885 [Burkholderia sp. TSV86]
MQSKRDKQPKPAPNTSLACNKRMKNQLALLTILLAVNVSAPAKTVLIATGNGADSQAASMLATQLTPAAEFVDLAQLAPQEIDVTASACIMIVGQRAADSLLTTRPIRSSLLTRPVAIYTHLLDSTIKTFVSDKIDSMGRLNLYTTDSQLALLQERDADLYSQLQRAHPRVAVYLTPLVMTTVRNTNVLPVPAPPVDYAIWLGGNYTTSAGTLRLFSTVQIVAALEKLRAAIAPHRPVGIFIMRRLFSDDMTGVEKARRLNAIRRVFPDNLVTLYVSNAMQQQLTEPVAGMAQPPSYSALMHARWADTTRHFASVDQYNLFSDLAAHALTPFLLDEQDQDQQRYAASYLQTLHRPRGPGMMELIRQSQCAPAS